MMSIQLKTLFISVTLSIFFCCCCCYATALSLSIRWEMRITAKSLFLSGSVDSVDSFTTDNISEICATNKKCLFSLIYFIVSFFFLTVHASWSIYTLLFSCWRLLCFWRSLNQTHSQTFGIKNMFYMCSKSIANWRIRMS